MKDQDIINLVLGNYLCNEDIPEKDYYNMLVEANLNGQTIPEDIIVWAPFEDESLEMLLFYIEEAIDQMRNFLDYHGVKYD